MEATRQPVLIFDLDGKRFGLDATKVLESVWLPELTLLEEAPPWVIGMFSLRGHIVPVTDLNLRFGHPAQPLKLSDQVIVLCSGSETMGLVVSEVLELFELLPSAIEPAPHFEKTGYGLNRLAIGVASIAEDLVTLIDVSELTKHSEALALEEKSDDNIVSKQLDDENDTNIRALFHARAITLRQCIEAEDISLLGLAVIEISGEYFGIELTAVQEFCNITQLRHIPCCPPHILGVMSLRGKLLSLIDPRRALNLPPSPSCDKAVIAPVITEPYPDQMDQLIGVAIDEIHDVIYLDSKKLHPPPSALRAQYEDEISGTALYNGKTMIVLNLPALLAREEWIVNENV